MKKIKKKWLVLLLVFAFVLSLGLVGCANDADSTQTGESDAEESVDKAKDSADKVVKDAEDSVRDMNYEDIKVTPVEAFDKLMELHPDAKIKTIALSKGIMEYEYVIEAYDDENNYEVKMNPVDATVISDNSKGLASDNENAEITKDDVAKVDNIIDQAKIEDGSASELDEWNIFVKDGKVFMVVEIGTIGYTYDMATEELIEK